MRNLNIDLCYFLGQFPGRKSRERRVSSPAVCDGMDPVHSSRRGDPVTDKCTRAIMPQIISIESNGATILVFVNEYIVTIKQKLKFLLSKVSRLRKSKQAVGEDTHSPGMTQRCLSVARL